MNCPSCGTPIIAGQANCTCGHCLLPVSPETDMPAELYTRMEHQVQHTSSINLRRGIIVGTACLHLFLLLERMMDTIFIGNDLGAGSILIFISSVIGLNIYLLIKRFFI